MPYDPACETLAAHLLEDEPSGSTAWTATRDERQDAARYAARVHSLATAIQAAVEAWAEAHPADDARIR